MHGTVARPEWHSALEALGLWVAEADADDPMQEYFTAEEAEEELEPAAAAAEPQPGAEQAELLALRARVAELEAAAVAAPPRNFLGSPQVEPRASASPLPRRMFQSAPGSLTAEEWATLRQLAGPAAGRLGKPETAPLPVRTTGADALADEAAGAGDLDAELEQIAAQSSDPLHLLLANQACMMQQLLPRWMRSPPPSKAPRPTKAPAPQGPA